jgi:hypothetical protein
MYEQAAERREARPNNIDLDEVKAIPVGYLFAPGLPPGSPKRPDWWSPYPLPVGARIG